MKNTSQGTITNYLSKTIVGDITSTKVGGKKRKVGACVDDFPVVEMDGKRIQSSMDQKPDKMGAESRTQDEPASIQLKIRAFQEEIPRELEKNVYFL